MTECIVHVGTRTGDGYGMLWQAGRQWLAHRLAWTQAYGPIPDGMLVCHHCDNPPCINLSHLFLGTPADNARDRQAKGRSSEAWHSPAHRQGSLNGNAKLTSEKVRELRTRHELGASYSSLAREVGMNIGTVRSAILGHTWSHV